MPATVPSTTSESESHGPASIALASHDPPTTPMAISETSTILATEGLRIVQTCPGIVLETQGDVSVGPVISELPPTMIVRLNSGHVIGAIYGSATVRMGDYGIRSRP